MATGSSFQAKPGHNDDLISAVILTLRMVNIIKDWHPNIYESFSQVEHNEQEYEMPMPIFVSSNV